MKKLFLFFSMLLYGQLSFGQGEDQNVPEQVKDAWLDSLEGLPTLAEIFYFLSTLVFVILLYFLVRYVLDRQIRGKLDKTLIRSILLFSIGLIGAIAVILSLPMSSTLKGQVTNLIGIVLAAALSLSSATFLGNVMAGIMLGALKSFKPGDFVLVNDIFGRVTEKGLLHTEIQTEDRGLTTLPNLYLANNPVKVTRSTGAYISSTCSLGYDVSRVKIEKCLIEAAKKAELEEPFVHIIDLGDFSVVYKVSGLLKDNRTLISSQSKLNAMILDTLHEAGIEIMSPNFVNQRQIMGEPPAIPKKLNRSEIEEARILDNITTEHVMFDKAQEAETIENRKEKIVEIEIKVKGFEEEMRSAPDSEAKKNLQEKIKKWKEIREKLITSVDQNLEEINKKV